MGKSSLRVQTMQRLQDEGIACGSLDLTRIGSQEITPEHWYAGIVRALANNFNLLDSKKLRQWWRERDFIPPVQRFDEFIEQILLVHIPQDIVIFIDEIDNVLRLNFRADDFFTAIRACYDRRATHPQYKRLSFVLIGVATPSDLMRQNRATPFNIGYGIELKGFQLGECAPLTRGLVGKVSCPTTVLKEILRWTEGKPFLTQKLCQLVLNYPRNIEAGQEQKVIKKIVQSCILHNWETQDEPEHLRTIRDRLLQSSSRSFPLLNLYRNVLIQQGITYQNTALEMELCLSGLVVKRNQKLTVYNHIYYCIFNRNWVEDAMNKTVATRPKKTQVKRKESAEKRQKYEQKLYKHLIYWVERESPEEIIKRFHHLFFLVKGYPDEEMIQRLHYLLHHSRDQQKSINFINRCCYIIVNRWRMTGSQRDNIKEFLALFIPLTSEGIAKNYRYGEILEKFTKSQEFRVLCNSVQSPLQNLVHTIKNQPITSEEKPLRNLIKRYPYLYSHNFLRDNSTFEYQKKILQSQAIRQRQFEKDIAKYTTFLLRKSTYDNQLVKPYENPTLLSDNELMFALKQFIGRVEGSQSYKDLAQVFLQHTHHIPSYGLFKDELYEYLIASIDSDYGRHQFNQRLYRHLQNTFPDSNSHKLDDFLLMNTCRKLLNFLVVTNSKNPNHYIFIDLISNIGPIRTTSLLLKILLLSHNIRPDLEKRFSILFNHYESQNVDEIHWFVKSLENLNVALVGNFGDVDLSFLQQIL